MIRILPVLAVAVLTPCVLSFAAEPVVSPDERISHFSRIWSEDAWQGGRRAYMRPLEDSGWPARMQALQGLVAGGATSMEPLLDVLKSGSDVERILAAQALGYLTNVPRDALWDAARTDKNAAVRLYAVDALGMHGGADISAELKELASGESNGDVKKHIGYAQERKQVGVDGQVLRDLAQWDTALMDSATVGQPAPDFSLTSLGGEQIRLSQYRGKKAVVLVFIYGDT